MHCGQILNTLTHVVDELSERSSYEGLFHHHTDGSPLPSAQSIKELVDGLRAVLFPGYYGNAAVNSRTISYHIGVLLENVADLLRDQILAGLCFEGQDEDCHCTNSQKEEADKLTQQFIASLPQMRRILATDVKAMYNGDPAAHSYGEVISCYPAIKAISNYRIAHRLVELNVPLIPRIITEMAHSETGIDINPEATIGHSFAMDHGTGIVIGATSIIGNNVKLYQGVTLGAKSFKLDDNGNPIKDIPRHPIIEDDVVIYSNATILGRITIGKGATIGGNIWVTESVKPGAKVTQNRARVEIDNYKNYAI